MAWWKTALRALGALVGLSVLIASIWLLSSNGVMRHVLVWLERLGPWGYVVLAGLFVPISTPFGYGYTAVGFTCGALYGVVRGTLVMVVGADGGAVLAFVVIRYLFKDWFREWLSSKRRLRLLMRAVDVNATKFAFLSRFTPIPWGIQNTIYAVSDIELWKFALLTSFGGFPDQVIIAFMGSQVQVMLIADGHVGMGTGKWVMVALELMACLALAVLMVIFAKRAIDQTNAEEDHRTALEAAQRAQAEAQRIMGVEPTTDEAAGAGVAPARRAEAEPAESEKDALLEPVELHKGRDTGGAVPAGKEISIEMAPLAAASAAAASAAPPDASAAKGKGASTDDTESPKARLLSEDATAEGSPV